MPDFVTLTCPSCSGKLKITPDMDRFACANGGKVHLVQRSDGVVALKPLQESLSGLARATDRTASEMAIKRLQGENAALPASKGPVAGKLTRLKAVIAAHKQRSDTVDFLRKGPLLIVALYLADRDISSLEPSTEWLRLLVAPLRPMFYWNTQLALALGSLACLRDIIRGRRPEKSRKEIEDDMASVESELPSIDETIRQREAEPNRHRSVASLSG